MTSDQNKYTYIDDTGGKVMPYYIVEKKSRHSKLKKKLKSLENRFDLLDDELLEIKWEIDDIKKNLLLIKSGNTKSLNKPKSNSSDEDIFT